MYLFPRSPDAGCRVGAWGVGWLFTFHSVDSGLGGVVMYGNSWTLGSINVPDKAAQAFGEISLGLA